LSGLFIFGHGCDIDIASICDLSLINNKTLLRLKDI